MHLVRLINTGPSVINAFLKIASLPTNICTINLAGEALPRALADRIFAIAPDIKLYNLYGPTETTVYSSWSRVDRSDRRPPAIGKPILNTQFYVADSDLELIPQGAPGELYIGG